MAAGGVKGRGASRQHDPPWAAGPGEITGSASLPGFTSPSSREGREAAAGLPCPPLCGVCPCGAGTAVARSQPHAVCPQDEGHAGGLSPAPWGHAGGGGSGVSRRWAPSGASARWYRWAREKAAGSGPGKEQGDAAEISTQKAPARPGGWVRWSSSLSSTRCLTELLPPAGQQGAGDVPAVMSPAACAPPLLPHGPSWPRAPPPPQ